MEGIDLRGFTVVTSLLLEVLLPRLAYGSCFTLRLNFVKRDPGESVVLYLVGVEPVSSSSYRKQLVILQSLD